jgi:hypothetical protein
MAITIEELVQRYPVLYHMADQGSWPGIKKLGLLSPITLCNRFRSPENVRAQVLNQPRQRSMRVGSPEDGATVRDQKVLSGSKLANSLTDCTVEQWLHMLNSRVFFWLNRDRLFTLMNGREYRNKEHVVLTIQTEPLVREHADKITLTAMNTGSTSPIAHPRGLASFSPLSRYPYEQRRRLNDYSAIVELVVDDGIRDLLNYIVRVERAKVVGDAIKCLEVLYEAE